MASVDMLLVRPTRDSGLLLPNSTHLTSFRVQEGLEIGAKITEIIKAGMATSHLIIEAHMTGQRSWQIRFPSLTNSINLEDHDVLTCSMLHSYLTDVSYVH